ncbi:MAG: acetyltransferase [Candidatus Magnetomorum sp.]|nr:acetyltransferase [Candidatus Magnetomorum sp.]
MKKLVFFGGGGFFLELFEYIKKDMDNKILSDIQIKGFIDDNTALRYPFCANLGTIADFKPEKNDCLLITIGNPWIREKFFVKFQKDGCDFFSYIHPSAIISSTAKIGKGCIVCPFSMVNAYATVEDNVVINVHASIGHESLLGQSCVLSPYAAINGNAQLGAMSFMGTRSTVFPGVSVGKMSTIDSHSYAKFNTDEKTIVSLRSKYLAIKNRMIK